MIGLSDLSGLNINLQIPENFARYNSGLPIWGVSRELKLVVFRQVQECLANIHCHSAAKNAVMRIERANDTLAVEVSDDGKGMSAEKLIEVQSAGSGVGIGACASGCANSDNMNIESREAGSRIVVTLPIINADEVPGTA